MLIFHNLMADRHRKRGKCICFLYIILLDFYMNCGHLNFVSEASAKIHTQTYRRTNRQVQFLTGFPKLFGDSTAINYWTSCTQIRIIVSSKLFGNFA
jgi:hypothetical protein